MTDDHGDTQLVAIHTPKQAQRVRERARDDFLAALAQRGYTLLPETTRRWFGERKANDTR